VFASLDRGVTMDQKARMGLRRRLWSALQVKGA
jgi:hypothetical protein